jgi:hypothetical protein
VAAPLENFLRSFSALRGASSNHSSSLHAPRVEPGSLAVPARIPSHTVPNGRLPREPGPPLW